MEKRLSVPEEILKTLVDLIAAGHYPGVSFGDINRALEMLRKSVKEVTPESDVQVLKDKVKSLEEELETLKSKCECEVKELDAPGVG